MLTYRRSLGIAPFLAVLLLLLPMQSWSAELPEGVTVQTVAEYSVDVSGLEKVVMRKIILQPGAKWEVTVKDQVFCNVTQGTILVADHQAGTSTLYTPGSRWAPAKGNTVILSNPGDETHVHWVYALIEKK